MKEYVVAKEFQDKFDNNRHCRISESHVPPSEERAKQLVDLGFISVVKESTTVRSKKTDPQPEGEADGKTTYSE